MRYFPKREPRLLYKRLTSGWQFMEVEGVLTRGKEGVRRRGVLIARTNSNSIFLLAIKQEAISLALCTINYVIQLLLVI